jgi:hypothetical protein
MKNQLAFVLTGLLAGMVCVLPGESFLMLLTLTWGVGPAFFIAVFAGLAITGARSQVRAGALRYSVGMVICFITYLLALMVFFAVYGFSPDWFGFRPSNNIDQFGIDVWLGLIAAGTVGASGIALFTVLLSGKWSKSLPLRLMTAGILTIVVTYIVNLPFRSYWSFFGVLIPGGMSLFCWVVGTHISQHLKPEGQIAVIGREPQADGA